MYLRCRVAGSTSTVKCTTKRTLVSLGGHNYGGGVVPVDFLDVLVAASTELAAYRP
jgi:hypothetical protein